MIISVQNDGLKLMVDLPRRFSDDRAFELKIGDKKFLAKWNSTFDSLCLIDDGVERNINVRNFELSASDYETLFSAQYFAAKKGVQASFAASVEPYVSGSENRAAANKSRPAIIRSPIAGKVLSVHAAEGDKVASGDLLFVVEAMKMENKIFAPSAGVFCDLKAGIGDNLATGQELAHIKPEG